jgi:hypothetical protein
MRISDLFNESATAGATGAASIATAPTALGGIGVGFDPSGDKGIYQAAKKHKANKPLLIKRIAESDDQRMISMGSLCAIKVNYPDADFWITRRGSDKTVGMPVKQYSPEAIGIKVERTDLIAPDYLFYLVQYWHNSGIFKSMATGSLKLVHITVGQISKIGIKIGE